MIPAIFVSSTISDLAHLRDGIREAIEELSFRPVMSEYGEVGYLNDKTAAESCYQSVSQCQMVILIVGRRYGFTGQDGISITHREFRTAKDSNLPMITFVDPKIWHYRELFTTDPTNTIWKGLDGSDNAQAVFTFLNEIGESQSYNAIVPFTSVSDAKSRLKMQIANFVGDRLRESVGPVSREMREILAEVKTIRNQLAATSKDSEIAKQATTFLNVSKYLFRDSASDYRKFLEGGFGDVYHAIEKSSQCKSLAEVADAAGQKLEIINAEQAKQLFETEFKASHTAQFAYGGMTFSGPGRNDVIAFRNDKTIVVTNSKAEKLEKAVSEVYRLANPALS